MNEFIGACVFLGVFTLIFALKTDVVEWFLFYAILSAGCLAVSVYLALGDP